MASADNIIIPGKGAVFIGAVGATPPDYKTITPSAPGAAWTWLGNTSVDNNVALSKDGGDSTQYDGWWDNGLDVTYAATNWSLTINALEISKANMDLAFSGKSEVATTSGGYLVPSDVASVKKAVFIVAVQGTKRLGLHLPNVSITLGDAPAFDREALFEIPLSGNILADANGNLMEWFHKALDKSA
jgi:hypothetical protein